MKWPIPLTRLNKAVQGIFVDWLDFLVEETNECVISTNLVTSIRESKWPLPITPEVKKPKLDIAQTFPCTYGRHLKSQNNLNEKKTTNEIVESDSKRGMRDMTWKIDRTFSIRNDQPSCIAAKYTHNDESCNSCCESTLGKGPLQKKKKVLKNCFTSNLYLDKKNTTRFLEMEISNYW